MANTDLSYYASDVYIAGDFVIEWYQAGAADIYPGYSVMHDDADEVSVGATDAGYIYGHAALKYDDDIDTVYASGEDIPIICRHVGTLVWSKHDGTSRTILKGAPIVRSDSVAGASDLWTYTDNTEATDSLAAITGWGAQYVVTGEVAIWFKQRT